MSYLIFTFCFHFSFFSDAKEINKFQYRQGYYLHFLTKTSLIYKIDKNTTLA